MRITKKFNFKMKLGVVSLCIFIAGLAGYIFNIISLIQMHGTEQMGLLIARILGIFIVPLGCILGYF